MNHPPDPSVLEIKIGLAKGVGSIEGIQSTVGPSRGVAAEVSGRSTDTCPEGK